MNCISTTCPGKKAKRGQALVFLLMVMVVLVFAVLWNFDLHRIIFARHLTQNAGDAAAIMAARWQGISLNLIGDLNLMQAAALSNGDTDTASAITQIQARLCYTGPMIAFFSSQQAAKNNGVYRNDDFDELCSEHAYAVGHEYPAATAADGSMLFPEPYPGCWSEYSEMLSLAALEGIAAGPDNAHLYADSTTGHTLFDIGFYEAVAGLSWCWFFNNEPSLLEGYKEFFPCWWPPLPEAPRIQYINSEIYGLNLARVTASVDTFTASAATARMASERLAMSFGTSTGINAAAAWYIYNDQWTDWDAIKTMPVDAEPFPVTGTVKPQYDYAGADAAVRIEQRVERHTPGQGGARRSNYITWTAAAKPFGSLNGSEKPSKYGLVLPAFREVRLIPMDASSAPAAGGYNIAWRRHIHDHIPEYLSKGPQQIHEQLDMQECWYCQQLIIWEDPSFRQRGIAWLSVNSYLCELPSYGGGPHRGGGSRRGH